MQAKDHKSADDPYFAPIITSGDRY